MTVTTLTIRLDDPAGRAALERFAALTGSDAAAQLAWDIAHDAIIEAIVMETGEDAAAQARTDAWHEALSTLRPPKAQGVPAGLGGAEITLRFPAAVQQAAVAAAAARCGLAPADYAAHLARLIAADAADREGAAAGEIPGTAVRARKLERGQRICSGFDHDPATGGASALEETKTFAHSLLHFGADIEYDALCRRLDRVLHHHARLFPDAPEAERHAALLRLGVEQSGVTEAELAARGHPARVWEILRITAAAPDEAPDEAPSPRAARIAASGDPGAMRVALAELAEEADPKRPAPRDAGTRAALERAAETLRAALVRTPEP